VSLRSSSAIGASVAPVQRPEQALRARRESSGTGAPDALPECMSGFDNIIEHERKERRIGALATVGFVCLVAFVVAIWILYL
jgi:hypothetical protein